MQLANGAAMRRIAMILAILAGCAAPPPLPERPAASPVDPNFAQGIAFAVDDLFIQLQRLPAFAPPSKNQLEKAVGTVLKGKEEEAPRSVIVVDTIIDATTGQQTRATQLAEQRLYERVAARFPQFEVGSARPEVLARAEYVLAATMTPVKNENGVHRVNMAMTDVRSALVIAQAGVRIRDETVDTTPTPFYRDSPALARDRVIEGQVRTAETAPGKPADSLYLERLPTNALINGGLVEFNKGDYARALPYYEEAAKRGDGQQLRVHNGLYLSFWNLGRAAEAETAFGRIVAIGLATNNLAVKFLFSPGGTEFWADPKISGPYPFWLKQIAQQVVSARRCLSIVGHSSRTGSEAFNDRLSLLRAEAIKAKLVAESRDLAPRIETAGAGFRENLIGTGTDDQRDSLDRRVEFRVVTCSASPPA
jgi:tetratricopeptide (TPR) repeat protein